MQKLIISIVSSYNKKDCQPKLYPVMYSSSLDLKEKLDELIEIRRKNLEEADIIQQNDVFPLLDEIHVLMSDRGDFTDRDFKFDKRNHVSELIKNDLNDNKKEINEKIDKKNRQIEELSSHIKKLRDSFVLIHDIYIDLSDIAPDQNKRFDNPFFVYTLDEWFDLTLKDFEKIPDTN